MIFFEILIVKTIPLTWILTTIRMNHFPIFVIRKLIFL